MLEEVATEEINCEGSPIPAGRKSSQESPFLTAQTPDKQKEEGFQIVPFILEEEEEVDQEEHSL